MEKSWNCVLTLNYHIPGIRASSEVVYEESSPELREENFLCDEEPGRP